MNDFLASLQSFCIKLGHFGDGWGEVPFFGLSEPLPDSFQQVLPAEMGRDVHTQLVCYTLKSKCKTQTAWCHLENKNSSRLVVQRDGDLSG